MATEQKTTVATPSKAVNAMADNLAMVRNLMQGTDAMRKAGVKHLPSWPDEDPLAYAARLAISTLFPAYSRTVTTLAGKPFSKPITYGEDVPANVKEWMQDDADLQGRNLDAFAACVLESALAYGMCGILTDYPRVEAGSVLTKAQEAAAGLRPYLVHVEPWNILGWRSQRMNGVETLTQLRLWEVVTEEDGEFGEKEVEQVRVLTPGAWATHRKDARGEWQPFDRGATTLDYIPFTTVYGQRTGFMTSRPPMLEMAHLNVKHWQSQSDQDNLLHVARVPILVVTGVDDDKFKMTVGASHAVKLPQGASAMFVEHSGAAIGAGKASLDDLKEEMRQAGAELLVLRQGPTTATEVASDNAVGMCALQRITAATEDALDQALQFAADWVKAGEGGHITLFNDYGAATLAEASAELLYRMTQTGDLSKVTFLNEVKRRGILSADVDVDKEIEAAEAEGPPLGTIGTGAANDNGPGAGARPPNVAAGGY